MTLVERLKAKALAVAGTCDHKHNAEAWTAFRYEASPSTVLELISQIEAQQAELDKLKSELDHRPYRPNIERTDSGLSICWNEHEKGDKCEYEHYVPAHELDRLRGMVPVEAIRESICTLESLIESNKEQSVLHEIDTSKEVAEMQADIKALQTFLEQTGEQA